jgi:hypothetical protein
LNDRDLARNLGQEGRRRVVERFPLERMVRETEDLYLELLEQKTKRRRPPAARISPKERRHDETGPA